MRSESSIRRRGRGRAGRGRLGAGVTHPDRRHRSAVRRVRRAASLAPGRMASRRDPPASAVFGHRSTSMGHRHRPDVPDDLGPRRRPELGVVRRTRPPRASGARRGEVLALPGGRCRHVRFSLSADGQRLTLTPVSDACADRATVLAGDWTRTDIGPLQPGRHEATDFRPFSYGTTGRLAYTVPAGWAGPDMKSGLFGLGRPSVSDTATITLISNAYASDQVVPCDTNAGAAGVGRTPEALSDWLRTLPGLVVSAPTDVTVGGLRGIMVDLSMAPGWTPTCDAGLYTFSFSGRTAATGRPIAADRDRKGEIHPARPRRRVAPGRRHRGAGPDWDAFLTDAIGPRRFGVHPMSRFGSCGPRRNGAAGTPAPQPVTDAG